MTRQNKNRIRALLLLMVFSVNTIAGFACSLGVDMEYNTKHHEKASSHSHEKGHSHNAGHKHSDAAKHSGESISDAGKANDCCSNGVTNFIKLDKSVAHNYLLAPVFLTSFITSAFILPVAYEANIIDDAKLQTFWRSWRLPYHTDLRIVIQSFQI